MARDLDVFRKHYKWVPDDALEFYKLHADVDVEHGVLRKEILKKYADTKELQEDCVNAQLMKNNMRRVMADCIYMAYVVQGNTCESTSAAA
jgi:pyrroloquinoline quinone (PQQ) biosynthesis protein C